MIHLYREGYSQQEISLAMRDVPLATINRWIVKERKDNHSVEIRHLEGAQSREIGVETTVWGPVAKSTTLFSQDAVTGEIRRGPGVMAASGTPVQIEEQLLEQMRSAYVPPKYNLPLLELFHFMDGLGFMRTAKAYEKITKRTISPSTVRRLLEDHFVGAESPDGLQGMRRLWMQKAMDEEELRRWMETPSSTPLDPPVQHRIQRISLTIKIGPGQRDDFPVEPPNPKRAKPIKAGKDSP